MTSDIRVGRPVAGASVVPSAPPDAPVPVGPDAPIMDVLRTMRAMRRLRPDPVPRELLERLVEAATWAPNAGNEQRFGYLVVTDRERLARVGEVWRDVYRRYLVVNRGIVAGLRPDPAALAVGMALRYQAEHF